MSVVRPTNKPYTARISGPRPATGTVISTSTKVVVRRDQNLTPLDTEDLETLRLYASGDLGLYITPMPALHSASAGARWDAPRIVTIVWRVDSTVVAALRHDSARCSTNRASLARLRSWAARAPIVHYQNDCRSKTLTRTG